MDEPTLRRMAKDRDSDVRLEVARHVGTPMEVLCQLVHDPRGAVAQAALDNPGFDMRQARQLVLDADYLVRQALARHPDLDELDDEALLDLTATNEQGVQDALAGNDRLPVARLWNIMPRMSRLFFLRRTLARQAHKLPEQAERELLADPDTEVQRGLAESSTRPDTLEELARHRDQGVRLAVATNQAASSKALARLARDRNPQVSSAARARLQPEPEKSSDLGVKWVFGVVVLLVVGLTFGVFELHEHGARRACADICQERGLVFSRLARRGGGGRGSDTMVGCVCIPAPEVVTDPGTAPSNRDTPRGCSLESDKGGYRCGTGHVLFSDLVMLGRVVSPVVLLVLLLLTGLLILRVRGRRR